MPILTIRYREKHRGHRERGGEKQRGHRGEKQRGIEKEEERNKEE